jgi:hypothetical protein
LVSKVFKLKVMSFVGIAVGIQLPNQPHFKIELELKSRILPYFE